MNDSTIISIIIPTYKDPFLQKTIDSLLENAQGDIEVIPVLDGYVPETPIKSDSRVKIINLPKNQGMRAAINAGLAKARGKFIMKCDAHCIFGPGYDKILAQNCAENWLMIPRRYSLEEINWQRDGKRPIKDYLYLTIPMRVNGYGICLSNQDWLRRGSDRQEPEYDIDDTMTFQGSCWLANKKYFMKRVGFLDDRRETYGTFVDEPQEIGLKYWLGGGENKVIKKTWYAHLSKQPRHYQSGIFTREYKISRDAACSRTWTAKHWLNNEEPNMIHPFSWLVEKFWPVPTWPEDRNLWVFQEIKHSDIKKMPNSQYPLTALCKLAMKYNSDKCPRIGHCYTPFYYNFLKGRRRSIKKVLEVGIGHESMRKTISNYVVGAGMRMWRDFFPNATVFGADIIKESLFTDNRIATYYCDERNAKDIKNLISLIGNDIDIVIDDASHHIQDQMFLFQTLMPLLDKGVTYIVEDCLRTRQMRKTFSQYNCYIPELLTNESQIRGGLVIFTYK